MAKNLFSGRRGAAALSVVLALGAVSPARAAGDIMAGAAMDGARVPGLTVMADQQEASFTGQDQVAQGAQDFIDRMAHRALSFLGDTSLPQAKKDAAFRKLLFESFDLDTIGRFVLGRYWHSSTPEQRDEYLRLFRENIANVYARRFQNYNGQKFETKGFRPEGDKDTIVSSTVIPTDNSPEVEVDWRVRYKNGRYQVVDVVVEGVSMSVTQRSDYASVIQRGGGDIGTLLAYLKNGGAPEQDGKDQ